MDGFKQGVDYYNKENGKSVKVVGWDGKNGSFTGGFEANEKATNTAKQIIDQGADVILPRRWPDLPGRRDRDRRLGQGHRDDRRGRRPVRDRPDHAGRR